MLLVLLLAVSISAFGQFIDPQIQTSSGCSPNCAQTDPIPIDSTGFEIYVNNPTGPDSPWFLVIGTPVPDSDPAPTAPVVTSTGVADLFAVGPGADAGAFDSTSCPVSTCDVYSFSGLTATKIGSEQVDNWFGSAEQAAFGSTPGYFEIFVYTVTPALPGKTGEFFDASLIAGTFVVAYGTSGQFEFSNPFTTAGLVTSAGPGPGPGPGEGPGGNPAETPTVPEPNGIVLVGSALLAVCAGLRKRLIRS